MGPNLLLKDVCPLLTSSIASSPAVLGSGNHMDPILFVATECRGEKGREGQMATIHSKTELAPPLPLRHPGGYDQELTQWRDRVQEVRGHMAPGRQRWPVHCF